MGNWMVVIAAVVALMLIFFCILAIRAMLCRAGARRLAEKKMEFTQEQKDFYCGGLSKMIQCATVSHKDSYDDTEFAKLRGVMEELFPTVTARAERHIFGQDCWVYKIPGRNHKRNVMLMSHHDVALVEGEWEHDPFSGQVERDCVWGRGTVDTKTPLFAEFSALEELLREGFEPACNVYIASSHNEEISGDGIPLALAYFQKEEISFDWILDEGGAVIDAPMSGIRCKCAMLAVHEKGRHTWKLTAHKLQGHAGLSAKTDTPEVRMAAFITQIQKEQPFIRRMYPELRAMFESLSPYMEFPMRLVFSNMWLFSGLLKRLIPAMNAQAGAMLGTSCTFRSLCSRENGDCCGEAFLRCVSEEDLKQDIQRMKEIAAEYGIDMEEAEGNEYHPPASLKSSGYAYIKSCVEKQLDYAACAPFILPAGTDARHFCDSCDCVIRFAPIDINNQQYGSVHNVNENIAVEAVARAVVFYKELIRGIT